MRGQQRLLSAVSIIVALSALPAGAQIVINEIMYNSPGTDIEFIELVNAGGADVDLTGWYIVDDDPAHPHCPLAGVLAPGDYLVVVADLDLFVIQYPLVTNVNPYEFDPNGLGFSLGNGGDTVNVHRVDDTLEDTVTYDDQNGWPGAADGGGSSLELIYPLLDNSAHESWDASAVPWGTPGEINSVYQEDQTPFCRDGERDIPLPTSSDAVTIVVTAFDHEAPPTVELNVDTGSGFAPQAMFDDGLHGDGAAGDSLWGAVIAAQPSGTLVRYYAVASDLLGQSDTWPGDAPVEYRAYTVDHVLPALRINEILADNVTGITDEFGQFDDWIEIWNMGDESVALGGMFLSDQSDRTHTWQLPDYSLPPDDYLIVWADNEDAQGSLHTSFSLAADGEFVGLFETEDHGNVAISSFKYGLCAPDVSVGYTPVDGNYPEYLATSTPGASNESSAVFSDVCLNEFLTTSLYGGEDDWIEVFNRGGAAVDISGWLLSDERHPNDKWSFPAGAVLEPGEFLTVYESALGFGIASDGSDVIMLSAADSSTGMDFYDPGPQSPDTTMGRYPDGVAHWLQLVDQTPNGSNSYPIAVDEGQSPISGLRLIGSYPNPFNPRTSIAFESAADGALSLRVYDAQGRRIRELFAGKLPAGQHVFEWDGRDAAGRPLASGVYFVRVAGARDEVQAKLVLIK